MRSGKEVREQLGLKRDALLETLSETDWTLAWVVFKNLDVLSHALYDGTLDGRVARLLERLDEVLGALVEHVGDGVDVLLVSDHGFRSYRKQFNVIGWLLANDQAAIAPEAPTGQPVSGPLASARVEAHRQIMSLLDLPKTRAWPTKAEGHFGGLRLNVVGREPEGCVAPEDVEATLQQLERQLGALRTPSGRPLVVRTWRGPELYPGEFAERLPDLLFEVDREFAVFATRSSPAVLGPLPKPYPDHDRRGIFVAAGPHVVSSGQRLADPLSILDVTPTVLAALGVPGYSEMHGEARREVLSLADFPARTSEREAPTDSVETLRWLRSADTLDAHQLDELMERMKSLGYTE